MGQSIVKKTQKNKGVQAIQSPPTGHERPRRTSTAQNHLVMIKYNYQKTISQKISGPTNYIATFWGMYIKKNHFLGEKENPLFQKKKKKEKT